MCVLGLMLASVGQDTLSDIPRFTFNTMNLSDGISFVLVVMATFAMSEALTIILKKNDPTKAAKQIFGEFVGLVLAFARARLRSRSRDPCLGSPGLPRLLNKLV